MKVEHKIFTLKPTDLATHKELEKLVSESWVPNKWLIFPGFDGFSPRCLVYLIKTTYT